MSDCSANAWKRPKWTTQEWHAPDGRTVFIRPDEMPRMVSVGFDDGTSRDLPLALGGRRIVSLSLDGEKVWDAGA